MTSTEQHTNTSAQLGDTSSEPEDHYAKPEAENAAFAEPVPDWPVALEVWGGWWHLHVYLGAVLFLLLLVGSTFNVSVLLGHSTTRRLHTRWYFLALNLLLLVMALVRCIYCFADMYNYKSLFPLWLSYMMLSITLPCLSSGYVILLVTFVHITRMKSIHPNILRIRTIVIIIVSIFTITLIADIVTALAVNGLVLSVICSAFYCVWGLLLAIAYAIIVTKLYRRAARTQHNISQQSSANRSHMSASDFSKPKTTRMTSRASRSIQTTAGLVVLFFLFALLNLYGAVAGFTYSDSTPPAPWPWYGRMTALRVVELCLCFLLLYLASQPTLSSLRGGKLESNSKDSQKM